MPRAPVTPWNSNFDKTNPFSNTTANILLAAKYRNNLYRSRCCFQQFRVHISVSTSADVWVSHNGTAAVPTSNTVATNNQERVDVDLTDM